MKQAICRWRVMILFMLLLAALVPANAHAESMLSVSTGGKKIEKKIKVTTGKKIRLSVKYGEKTVRPKKAAYTSRKPKVATIGKKGVIRTREAGKTTIRVTYKGETLTFKVVVLAPKKETEGTGEQDTGTETTGTKTSGSETTGTETTVTKSSAGAGKLTCSQGKSIKTGDIITLNFNNKARKHDWTWSFQGTCGKDVHILKPKYKKTGKLVFTVWPSGGTLTVVGTDPAGLTICYKFKKVTQSKKWKKREKFRTDALAGITPGMTKKQMVVYFAEYIADHAKYGPGKGNFFRVIDKGVGDCWCYSTAFKLLADAVGIETIIVKNKLSQSHYWNQVKIKDVWYNVDTQGYDTGRSHHWILSSDKKHGSRWRGDPDYKAQFSIYYPVSPAHTCKKTLKFKVPEKEEEGV